MTNKDTDIEENKIEKKADTVSETDVTETGSDSIDNLDESISLEDKPNDSNLEDNDDISNNDLDYEDDVTEKAKDTKKDIPFVKVSERNHRAKLTLDFNLDKARGNEEGSISLPPEFSDKILEVFSRVARNHVEESEELQNWITILNKGMNITTNNEALCNTMEDIDSEWYQNVDVNGKDLGIMDIQTKKKKGVSPTGERAVLMAMRHLNVGSVIQVPLWHSGIWITLITPKESSVIDLYRTMDDEIVSMGRSTSGLIYSNMSVVIVKHVLGFIEEHIKNTSCDITQDLNIMDLISCNDLYPLAWGILCCMYPNGRMYERSCVTDGCNHVASARLDLRKLMWVNRKALSSEHKAHMLKRRPDSMKVDEVKNYQNDLLKINIKVVDIESSQGSITKVCFKTPNLTKYIEHGEKWINEINDMIEESVSTDLSSKKKEVYMQRHAQSSILRQYSHWVEYIEIDGEIIDSPESIDKVLTVYSGDDDSRKNFLENIATYIDNSTISLVGIPVYDCPVCKDPQDTNMKGGSEFINVIPIDIILTFFTLTEQIVQKIAAR